MEILFSITKYLAFGFFGLLGLFIVVALVFGDRIVTKWEYEAEFLDSKGKEFGEFDIKMSRVDKKEADFSLKTEFRMRHHLLTLHSTVQVFLDDLLVLEGMVREAGRINLALENLQNRVDDPRTGQICRVLCGGSEIATQEIVPD